MKIHSPTLTRQDGNSRLAARIETESTVPGNPETLWFEFPSAYDEWIYQGVEPFVTAMYPLASLRGETIDVEAPISPRLQFGLARYREIFNYWVPGYYAPVEIRSKGAYQAPLVTPSGVGAFFSGGVDAMHTLLRHVKGRQSVGGYGITHAFFLFNLDLHGKSIESYHKAIDEFKGLTEELGIELITGNTNIRRFRAGSPKLDPGLSRGRAAGAHLVAAAMTLSAGMSKVYIASSARFDYTEIEPSTLLLDQALSTEWFEVIHDGVVDERHDKIVFVADQPETFDRLRVCRWIPDGVMNCGECPKCVRTMTNLAILGKLERYSTFPPLKYWRIIKWFSRIEESYFLPNLLAEAIKYRRWRIAGLLWLSWQIARLSELLLRLVRTVAPDYRRVIPR
jgi:hypothetical protein